MIVSVKTWMTSRLPRIIMQFTEATVAHLKFRGCECLNSHITDLQIGLEIYGHMPTFSHKQDNDKIQVSVCVLGIEQTKVGLLFQKKSLS